MAKKETFRKVIANNKRAKFDYHLIEVIEVGLILMGTEVKSLRIGKASLNESYAGEMNGGISLINASIAPYPMAKNFNHEEKRPREVLMHKKQRNKWLGAIRKKGLTLVPVSLYFNEKGIVKLELGLGQGKAKADKRETIKERDWNRDKARVLKGSYD
ncbi:MAG: SsrA-binding protein SmpB [Alphaproteobacteria bacterium]|nr:SsrA-binding protein SmpB [Alphaproteobacteria bacterium]